MDHAYRSVCQRSPIFIFAFITVLSLLAASATCIAAEDTVDVSATSPAKENVTPLEKRSEWEEKAFGKEFTLTPHRKNYFMPVTYSDKPNNSPFDAAGSPIGKQKNEEFTFQLSVKTIVKKDIFTDNLHLFAAYTQRSFWQVYNKENSRPFRETNYEPEGYFTYVFKDKPFWLKTASLGFNHQSNGQTDPLSRSWNRLFAHLEFERERLFFFIRSWYRFPEGDNDNNPDIEDYLGNGEVGAAYYFNKNVVSVLLRNNLKSHNHGSITLDLSFPFLGLNWYVQYFNGYGESLVDYNHNHQRIGLGFILSNWL